MQTDAPQAAGNNILVDVEGVIFQYDKWVNIEHYGEPITDNIELINNLYEGGYNILIWTTRINPTIHKGYTDIQLLDMLTVKLKGAGVQYTGIIRSPKPLCCLIIDDDSWNPVSKKLTDMVNIGDNRCC